MKPLQAYLGVSSGNPRNGSQKKQIKLSSKRNRLPTRSPLQTKCSDKNVTNQHEQKKSLIVSRVTEKATLTDGTQNICQIVGDGTLKKEQTTIPLLNASLENNHKQ